MKIFGPLYERTLRWAAHPKAAWMLFALSTAEAVFFPVAPEVMLAPMSLANRAHALRYAAISLGGSVVGMTIGYALGHYAIDQLMPVLQRLGYADHFAQIKQQANAHGFWLLLLAGFTPVPFKIFTLASGAISMPLLPFYAGAIIGRGKRVFLVAGAIKLGGVRAEAALLRWIEPVGWVALLLFLAVVGWLAWRGMH
jgi:membrane protein YqaA with SNARE-associated domain